jgi:hypothetical protein
MPCSQYEQEVPYHRQHRLLVCLRGPNGVSLRLVVEVVQECAECEAPFLEAADYLCPKCRELINGGSHPLTGRTIVSVIHYGDMRGTTIHLDDGSSFKFIYSDIPTGL